MLSDRRNVIIINKLNDKNNYRLFLKIFQD